MPVGPALPPAELPLAPRDWTAEMLRRMAADGRRRRPPARAAEDIADAGDDRRDVVTYTSEDLLGLATHPRVVEAAVEAARLSGVGARGSRPGGPGHAAAGALAGDLAEFTGAPAVTLAPSGGGAVVAVLRMLGGADAVVAGDEGNGTATADGCLLGRTNLRCFPHRDLGRLDDLLRRVDGRAIIVSEVVFGSDGSVADVAGLHAVASRRHAWLVLDEGHATGVMGPGGRGPVGTSGIDTADPRLVRTLALDRALGAGGGAVASSELVAELLQHRARAGEPSGVLPHPVVAAARAALATLRDMPELVARLHQNSVLLRSALAPLAPLGDSGIPILSVPAGDRHRAAALERALLRRGHLVEAVGDRLRIVVRAAHRHDDLLRLAADLCQLASVTVTDAIRLPAIGGPAAP